MFLDEPTSGLDPVAAHEVHDLINGLRQRGVTVFLTTHRLDEAERLCDRVAILNTTLRSVGQPDELRERLFAEDSWWRHCSVAGARGVFGSAARRGELASRGASSYMLGVDDPRNMRARTSPARWSKPERTWSRSADERHSLEDVYLELIDDDVEAPRDEVERAAASKR